jgi:PKD repeat protein
MKKKSLIVAALIVSGGLLSACGPDATDFTEPAGQDVAQQAIAPAIAVQARNVDRIMGIDGVVGTGVALDAAGRPVIRIFTQVPGVTGIPERLEGVPVSVEVTGMFVARQDPKTRFARPVPIGVSTGHPEITAGTIGARVTDGTEVYILSNNHILANENDAGEGDAALQPGPYDGGTAPDDIIGWLSAWDTIDFNGGDNTIDAAIARSTTAYLGYSTTAAGYGTPSSTTKGVSLGQVVRKYGRTTGLTEGNVSEISVTVDVCYECAGAMCKKCKKSARFVDQIAITPGNFSGGGDSGSLIVDIDNHPVGLLFAGSPTHTLANRIDLVLQHFGVAIDDGSSGTNNPPAASFTFVCTDLTCDFDGSGSSDSEGPITSWDWDFGDGTSGSGATPSHTYNASGTYAAALTVTDDAGATDRLSQDVRVGAFLHVGGVEKASTKDGGGTWTAWVRITVHQADHTALEGAVVKGTWDNSGNTPTRSDECTTGSSGMCEMSYGQIPNADGNILFILQDVVFDGLAYDAAEDHDPGGNRIRVFFRNSDPYK